MILHQRVHYSKEPLLLSTSSTPFSSTPNTQCFTPSSPWTTMLYGLGSMSPSWRPLPAYVMSLQTNL